MKARFSFVTFVVGVIIGLAVALWWSSGGAPGDLPLAPFSFPDSIQKATTTPAVHPKSESVSVEDQAAGDSVLVDSVTVPPPGVWIAVREVVGASGGSDALGNILGAARVGGPRTNISVPLLRATTPGETYAALLYRDDGDGKFDPSTDSVYVDFDTGLPAISYFATTAE